MVIDLITIDTGDGFIAEVPSLKGCETWAHTEDEAIKKAEELVRFYTHLEDDKKIKIDRARKSGKKIVYKLIFEK